MSVIRGRMRLETIRGDATVTPLELFFDLVFVFALTQVTAFMAAELSWQGLLQGLLIFGLLWWSWVAYAWLGNVVKADEGACRLVMFGAMAAMFVIALSIPESFDDLPTGLHAPVVIAVCYFLFRSIHLVMYWIAARGDGGLRAQLGRFSASMFTATTLLLLAAGADGKTQTALWGAALLADYGGTYVGGASGWRIGSARHFAERHGLILIVALGESIVAIGVGIADRPISWAIIVASALGLLLAGALWWAYFDTSSLLCERALAACPDAERARLARDAYSYLHLPLIAGVVLLALGLKKVLEYVSDTEHHDLSDPLKGVGLTALVIGVALYLLSQVAFVVRACRIVKTHRAVVALALLVLLPLGPHIPALATLGIVAGVVTGMIGWETWRFAEERDRIRHDPRHP